MSIYRVGLKNNTPTVFLFPGGRVVDGDEAELVLAVFLANGGDPKEQEEFHQEQLETEKCNEGASYFSCIFNPPLLP